MGWTSPFICGFNTSTLKNKREWEAKNIHANRRVKSSNQPSLWKKKSNLQIGRLQASSWRIRKKYFYELRAQGCMDGTQVKLPVIYVVGMRIYFCVQLRIATAFMFLVQISSFVNYLK
ncbi:hypothetical protein R6Q59_035008 [Mikania micrantha]